MIDAGNLRFYLSGGESNSDPRKSTGGPRSKTQVGAGLFPNVTSQQALMGVVQYRCVYFVNEDPSQDGFMEPARLWLREVPDGGQKIEIAVDVSGRNGAASEKPSEKLQFKSPRAREAAALLPETPYHTGDHVAIWIRRTIPPKCEPSKKSGFDLVVEGDSI